MRAEIRYCKYCKSKTCDVQENPGLYGYRLNYKCGSSLVVDYTDLYNGDSEDTFNIKGCSAYNKTQKRIKKLESIGI